MAPPSTPDSIHRRRPCAVPTTSQEVPAAPAARQAHQAVAAGVVGRGVLAPRRRAAAQERGEEEDLPPPPPPSAIGRGGMLGVLPPGRSQLSLSTQDEMGRLLQQVTMMKMQQQQQQKDTRCVPK